MIDDDVRITRVVRRGLEPEGYAVDVAEDIEQGGLAGYRELLQRSHLDVMLPGTRDPRRFVVRLPLLR